MKPIYLDYNATAPIDRRVGEAMLPFIHEHFGNPSSSHSFGITTKKAIEKARRQVSEMLHCQIDELIFTSGGSESNNYAIKGVARAYRKSGNHIITSAIEHPAVTEVCRYLEGEGYRITYLPVDEFGLIDPRQVEEAIGPQTILITIMHANNEVGTIEPISEMAEIAHRHNILIHSDCAQSVGKIPVYVDKLNVDMLSIAGHKLYAPKGIGALYIKSGVKLEKQVHGADHEMNWRAGTENVLEIVGLGEACEMVSENLDEYHDHMRKLRDRFEERLLGEYEDIKINGHPERRLPNTSSLSFRGLEANTILAELKNVAASAGAACHSDNIDVSHVLEAMGVPIEYAMGTIRFSVGRHTTAEEIDSAAGEVIQVIQKMKPTHSTPQVHIETGDIRLTQFTHGLGCACKLRPQLLEEVLRKMPAPSNANILVGTETSDDAAVYKIDERIAIVQTVDFFTPIVDDPYQFGAIAAANSLSDIYAMGGKPLFALNVVGFPGKRLPINVLEQILKGAAAIAEKAGIVIIGGHTVDDIEPKYGLAVTGVIEPDKVITNRNAQVGDVLILTKPLGTGILSTALKQNLLDEDQKRTLIDTMASLNKAAAEVMQEVGANACTDITGFGLMGHLLEMMNGSGTSAVLDYDKVPFLSGAMEYAVSGVIPGGTNDNYAYTAPHVRYDSRISKVKQLLINDAQTSGGLLISVNENKAEDLIARLRAKNVESATIIGRVSAGADIRIRVG